VFSYDPKKPNDPYKKEFDEDHDFEKEPGREYRCLCTYFKA
jgi:hypothetical protein